MTVCKKNRIKRTAFFLAAALLIIFVVLFIYQNRRFPKAELRMYTKEDVMDIEGLKVAPVSCEVMKADEFYERYPENEKYDHLKDSTKYDKDDYRIIVYTIQINNSSNKVLKFYPHLLHAAARKSKWSNACTRIKETYKILYLPGESETVELVTSIKRSGLEYRFFNKYEEDSYYLIASFYPVRREILFD